jgi:serine/threonine-protein kinase
MYCAQCGTLVSANSRFCVGCGARVTDASGAAGTAPGTIPQQADGDLLISVRRALAADYEVESEVGRGGMAVVFRARERELDRLVALKVLPPELAPVATVADRFKREARLAASLDHPNIIPVYRVGSAGGVLYMAMKYIDGRSLDALIGSGGMLSLPVVLTVLRAAARASAYAHEQGIVHRDIKGANILIDRQGRVVVTDFGIARAVESASLTATGVMIGTPHFMSPDQCSGKAVGPQSDQYSLGILAYQLLTGSVPFDGDSLPEILQHHWFTPPPDVTLVRADCPAALTAIVQRLLAKAPADRFGSTNELVAALDAIPLPTNDLRAGEAALRALVNRLAPAPAAPATPQSSPAALAASQAALAAPPAPSVPPPPSASQAATVPLQRPAPATPPPSAPVPAPPQAARNVSSPTVPLATPVPPGAKTRVVERQAPPAPQAAERAARPRSARRRPAARFGIVVGLVAVILVAAGAAWRARRPLPPSPALSIPRTATDLRTLGQRAYRAGDYELARRFFVRALAADPTDATAHAALGCTLVKLGRVDTSRTVLAHSGVKGDC